MHIIPLLAKEHVIATTWRDGPYLLVVKSNSNKEDANWNLTCRPNYLICSYHRCLYIQLFLYGCMIFSHAILSKLCFSQCCDEGNPRLSLCHRMASHDRKQFRFSSALSFAYQCSQMGFQSRIWRPQRGLKGVLGVCGKVQKKSE